LFYRHERIQLLMLRVLYVWAIRHPASGYVQGINEFLTPFITVFFKQFAKDIEVHNMGDLTHITDEDLNNIEADSYWCVTAFIDGIQDHYTESQPGIQAMMLKMQDIIQKVDKPLAKHLDDLRVNYVQFAFRWMNCLLMREIPIAAIIRLLDTYTSEDDFATFHIYLCSAFLKYWSPVIKTLNEFSQFMVFIQNLPTEYWKEEEISLLLSEAYVYKTLYHEAHGHFV